MNVSGVSLKEAMEAIEERIPLGRWIVKIVLFLAILAVLVWLCKFLYHDLVSPIATAASSLFASGNVKFSRGVISDLISTLFLGALFIIFSRLLSAKLFKIVREMLELDKSMEGHVAEAQRSAV
jgi:hypothetical protein